MSELIACSILLVILAFFAAGAYMGAKLSAFIRQYKQRKALNYWRPALYTIAAVLIVFVVMLVLTTRMGFYLLGPNGAMLGLSMLLSMEFGMFVGLSEEQRIKRRMVGYIVGPAPNLSCRMILVVTELEPDARKSCTREPAEFPYKIEIYQSNPENIRMVLRELQKLGWKTSYCVDADHTTIDCQPESFVERD